MTRGLGLRASTQHRQLPPFGSRFQHACCTRQHASKHRTSFLRNSSQPSLQSNRLSGQPKQASRLDEQGMQANHGWQRLPSTSRAHGAVGSASCSPCIVVQEAMHRSA